MDLFENVNQEKNTKKKNNINKVIIILIVLLLVIIMSIIGIMMYLQTLTTKFYIDGVPTSINESYFEITQDGKIYISIQDMAKLIGNNYYNGEYGKISEDTSKGYVSFEEETVTFEANSNKIYKIQTTNNEEKYSYMYLDEDIKLSNGRLYTTPDGIIKILNISFSYNENISVFTLEYLNQYYTGQIANYKYKKISDKFENQKALKNDILIVEREDGKKAIIRSDGTQIVGAKYDDITYLENTGDYMVTSGNKFGIINSQGKSKIDLEYEKIEVLDEDLGLYKVKQNNKYGVVNKNGNIVIFIENDEIGVDSSLYKDSLIKNPYILFDNCIPVQKDKKWGIYNKNGKLILPIEYDTIGCVVGTSSTNSTENVVVVEDYEAIVIGRDKFYGIINSIGKELIPCALDTVYAVTSGGKKIYRIEGVQNGSKYSYDLEKYFDAINVKKVNRSAEEKQTENIENIENNTNSTTNETQTNNSVDENQVNEETTNTNEDTLVVEQ